MSTLSFKQALCNAIEAEREASELYTRLADKAQDPNTIAFLQDIAKTETKHMQELEKIKGTYTDYEFCQSCKYTSNIEAPLGWDNAEEINFVEAIELAIQGENNASMIYDAMADSTDAELSDFFRSLSRTESLHAKQLEKIKSKAFK